MKSVEITMQDDGIFMVADTTEGAAMPGAMPGAAPQGETYQSIDEALQAAKAMLMQTEAGMAEQSDQQAGFDTVMGGAAA